MAATATLSSKYQISVPKAIRDDLHWKAVQEFVFIPKGKGMLLMPVSDLEQLAGIAKGAGTGNYRDREIVSDARRRYLGLDRVVGRQPAGQAAGAGDS